MRRLLMQTVDKSFHFSKHIGFVRQVDVVIRMRHQISFFQAVTNSVFFPGLKVPSMIRVCMERLHSGFRECERKCRPRGLMGFDD
jgi:hypothetical protein